MSVTRKAAHIYADFCEDHFRRPPRDPVDRVQLGQLARERGQARVDLLAHRRDRLVQIVQVGEQLTDQKRVVGAEPLGQPLSQGRELLAELARARSARTNYGLAGTKAQRRCPSRGWRDGSRFS